MSTRLIQLQRNETRRVALVDEPQLRLLSDRAPSIYALANFALANEVTLSEAIERLSTDDALNYEPVYAGESDWRILPGIDHPEPTRCLVSGTGLTHLGSARDRQAMHAGAPAEQENNLTDSMKMFRAGLEGGRPEPGRIGISPEWFYKGTGSILRAHNQPLDVPPYAEDGGEEAEIAGIYINDQQGHPWRIGMAAGNEFSDHCFEKQNYLYLASSKLRACSIGPELVVDSSFDSVTGDVEITRANNVIWKKSVRSGEVEMCHSLQNIEHHHFKFEEHRRPGDLHVHFFGAYCLSFAEGVRLMDGDVIAIAFKGFGRPLRNPVKDNHADLKPVSALPMR